MAKPSRTTANGSATDAGTSHRNEEVQRGLETLRKNYGIGKDALAAEVEESRAGGETIERIEVLDPQRVKFRESAEFRWMRMFAELYTEKEKEELFQLRKGGHPLTWSHVKELLKVKDKAKRKELQEETAKQAWSSHRLKAEIDARGLQSTDENAPNKRGGGRKYVQPDSPQVALVKFSNLTDPWLSYYEQINGANALLIDVARVPDEERAACLQLILKTKMAVVELVSSARLVEKQLQQTAMELERALRGDEKSVDSSSPYPKLSEKPVPQPQEARTKPKNGPPKRTRSRSPDAPSEKSADQPQKAMSKPKNGPPKRTRNRPPK